MKKFDTPDLPNLLTHTPEENKIYAQKLHDIGEMMKLILDKHNADGGVNTDNFDTQYIFNKEHRDQFMSIYNKCVQLQKERGEDGEKKDERRVFESGYNEHRRPKNTTVEVLHCGHKFHYKCIKNWEAKKRECPVCKKEFDSL